MSRLHDPANRVVSVVKCSTMHGDELLPENRDYCDRSLQRYGTYDYADLMNSTFGLLPSGRSPGTFRLGEVREGGPLLPRCISRTPLFFRQEGLLRVRRWCDLCPMFLVGRRSQVGLVVGGKLPAPRVSTRDVDVRLAAGTGVLV